MKTLGVLGALAAAAAAWSAVGLAMPVHRRELGGILMCSGANATGHCEYQVFALDTCHDVSPQLYLKAVTFAPDGEDFYCYPYATKCGEGVCTSPTGCTLGAVSYGYSHKYNLSEVSWDTSVASFECHAGKPSSSSWNSRL